MPIKPPNLDDRQYDDIVREARALIPQYCPEWTNLSDADPGMTLVQLFAWMTEMTIHRLNRIPDRTYVHFLNFIGEERRTARPAVVPVTFSLLTAGRGAAELPAGARVSTTTDSGGDPLHYVTAHPLTVHGATIDRVLAVDATDHQTVREIRPSPPDGGSRSVLRFGAGAALFDADPAQHGRHAYTAEHYLYLGHEDLGAMDFQVGGGQEAGRLRLRSTAGNPVPIADLFRWECHTEEGWIPLPVVPEAEPVRGLPDVSIVAQLPGQAPVDHFGAHDDPLPMPESFRGTSRWIRGVVDYERWLAARMTEDLEIAWQDDRGGDRRALSAWSVRSAGRALEFTILDLPPIRSGWTLTLTLADRGMPAGRDTYFPHYRFTVRRAGRWEPVPADRVRMQGTSITISGPLLDLATDGVNLRAERVETVSLRALVPELGVQATWLRPVEVHLATGSGVDNAQAIARASLPRAPFEPALGVPAAKGMKLYVGSDLFANAGRRPVLVELEVSFEVDGEPHTEPVGDYHLQLTYRASDAWRVVQTPDDRFSRFTIADLDPEGAGARGRRTVRFVVDPKRGLSGAVRALVAGVESAWLRFELTKAQLLHRPDAKQAPVGISMVLHAVRVGLDGVIERTAYEQPLSGLMVAAVEARPQNRRMSRVIAQQGGRLDEQAPLDRFIDVGEGGGGHRALYLRLTEPLPAGTRHAIQFRCTGQAYLPENVSVDWELLEGPTNQWRRLTTVGDPYRFERTGVLAFSLPRASTPAPAGAWLRAVLRTAEGAVWPRLPSLSHILLNTVDAMNLHRFTTERFSGHGVAHQTLQLRRSPLYVPGAGPGSHAELGGSFEALKVEVTEEDGQVHQWSVAPGNSMLTAAHSDRVFIVDPVEGVLTFGNGVRGRMLPVGQNNVNVDAYHVVPGGAGNVGPGMIQVADGLSDTVTVTNALPGQGGCDAESIDAIIRRAPSVLTSRDRAVTRADFEAIAQEASGQVARAACTGEIGDQGEVEVVILPRRRQGDAVPDQFIGSGLEKHVQAHLAHRCLVNVQPAVRLATFTTVDVSVTVRARDNAGASSVRDEAAAWVTRFLDPYDGGLDGTGWPFGAPFVAADVGRMVTDLPGVRHVVEVLLYPVADDSPSRGWEQLGGHSDLTPGAADLFAVRHVRVQVHEGAR